jgi:UDP-2-acetamido-2-deoxy-ribo-hexuluronate aminotransferase
MDLLLDVDIVIGLCAPRLHGYQAARSALDRCAGNTGRVWLYSGSVQTLVHRLTKEIAIDQPAVTITMAKQLARQKLKSFSSDKQWLAALAGEGDVFDADDPEHEQLLRALDRFADGQIVLITCNQQLLDRKEPRILSPEQYLSSASEEKPIDFINLKTQQDQIRPVLEKNIHRVLHHGQYIMGPEIDELEGKLAAYVGTKYCISASSGTDTLLIAMMALGIGQGDEVITTPFTFIATGEMIVLLGANPVFVDIDPRTYNIDPSKIEAAITPKTKAIMPVSLYGQCVDMDAINSIAKKHRLPVIEDAAQSFGATYKGRKSCALSTIGSTSFFPSKPLGGYGEGGALFTDNDELAKAMREIRVHGQDRRYHHPRIGINGRMDTLQAAIVLAKLERFDREVTQRQQLGARYTDLLSPLRGNEDAPAIQTPYIHPHNTSVYAQYTLQVQDRDALQAKLKHAGIPTAVHYPMPITEQPAIKSHHHVACTPIANAMAKRVLSLPMGPYLSIAEQNRIVSVLAAG